MGQSEATPTDAVPIINELAERLSRFSVLPPELKEYVDGFDKLDVAVTGELDPVPAEGADVFQLRLKPTDWLLRFLAAARAHDQDGVGHEESSSTDERDGTDCASSGGKA